MNFESNVVYGQVLGAGLLADVAWPETEGPHPAILSVHGGRWIRGTRHDNGAIDVKQWAEMGFFAMAIDYRLVTCSPVPACYQDVLCALRWLHAKAKQYNLDPKRIFLIGQSAGGHLVSLATTLGLGRFDRTGGHEEFGEEFAGAISVSGAYDLKTLDWGSGWCPLGQGWDVAREYASPLTHVSQTSKPLLLFHSDDDRSVPVDQALRMVEKLAAEKAPHTFVHHSDRDHMLISEDIIAESLKFIKGL